MKQEMSLILQIRIKALFQGYLEIFAQFRVISNYHTFDHLE